MPRLSKWDLMEKGELRRGKKKDKVAFEFLAHAYGTKSQAGDNYINFRCSCFVSSPHFHKLFMGLE